MNISEVAIKAGLSVKTVRYYADIALVPEAERSAAGYRTYDEPALKKLIFANINRTIPPFLPILYVTGFIIRTIKPP